MRQNTVYSCFVWAVLFSGLMLHGCGPAPETADHYAPVTTGYVNFGHKVFNEACKATGVCDVQGASQTPSMNTVFQYVKCQRADSTDSMSISFYPNVLKTVQDSAHFQLDAQGVYPFEAVYEFDSLAAMTTKIPKGTTIPDGRYTTIVTGSADQTKWTIVIPRVLRPAQGKQ